MIAKIPKGLEKMQKNNLWIEVLESRSLLTPVVAVLDSGIDINHPDLLDNLWVNSREIKNNNIDDDNNGYIDDIHGWNFISNNNNVMDVYGHGTHIAGIVQGLSSGVKIVAIKMISDGGAGSTSAMLQGLDYIIQLKNRGENINTINCSWSLGSYGSSVVRDKFVTMNAIGIVIVCAAGNNGADLDISPNYPSSFKLDNMISVASITPDYILAGSSNYGVNTVHIAARGTLIYSTLPGSRYATLSGTSMAAPMVTGKISTLSGSVTERVFALLSQAIKTDSLSNKVSTGGYLKESWSATPPVVNPPVAQEVISGRVGIMNINRVYGWAHSSTLMNKPMLMRVVVSNRVVALKWANLYRQDLVASLGSGNHGFDIKLNRYMFRRGWNTMKIYAVNTETGSTKLLASGNIRRWV